MSGNTHYTKIAMKNGLLILFIFCLILSLVGCNSTSSLDTAKGDIVFTKGFYTNIDKVTIHIGDTHFDFKKAEDVKNICILFENIIGSKAPPNKIQVEGFYEIVFSNPYQELCVILTGPTILIDGIEYYTNRDINEPLSKYLSTAAKP